MWEKIIKTKKPAMSLSATHVAVLITDYKPSRSLGWGSGEPPASPERSVALCSGRGRHRPAGAPHRRFRPGDHRVDLAPDQIGRPVPDRIRLGIELVVHRAGRDVVGRPPAAQVGHGGVGNHIGRGVAQDHRDQEQRGGGDDCDQWRQAEDQRDESQQNSDEKDLMGHQSPETRFRHWVSPSCASELAVKCRTELGLTTIL